MAAVEEWMGVINGREGDRQSSSEHRQAQSKVLVHGEVGQLEGEGSLGFEDGGVGTSSGSYSKEGSDDKIGEVDRMVSKEGDEAKSSF